MITYILLLIEVVVGVLLVGVILLQRSKDQGLGLAFGAGVGESLFGSRAADVLVKATVILAVIFFINTTILAKRFSARPAIARSVQQVQPAAPGQGVPQQAPAAPLDPAMPAPLTPLDGASAVPMPDAGNLMDAPVMPIMPEVTEIPAPVE